MGGSQERNEQERSCHPSWLRSSTCAAGRSHWHRLTGCSLTTEQYIHGKKCNGKCIKRSTKVYNSICKTWVTKTKTTRTTTTASTSRKSSISSQITNTIAAAQQGQHPQPDNHHHTALNASPPLTSTAGTTTPMPQRRQQPR